MKKLRKMIFVWLLMCGLVPALALGQEAGGGHDEGGGSGDVFGDLFHIKRDAETGQPILQKRWIEYPQDVLDWGYCPIPLDAFGNEIPFVDLSCEPDPGHQTVEVDYFGRLSAGRTKERNNRMHFDEVIATFKMADTVTTEETGRIKLGFDCTSGQCASWRTIDSPMENMALYSRLMRYGHLQTDPLEVDTWVHGDPAQGTQYHPALDPATDWAKFAPELRHLLPASANTYGTEALESTDFVRAAAFLAGAADKTGRITVDLVQYLNRILKIALTTEMSLPNQNLLPALIRDCGNDPDNQLAVADCSIQPAMAGLPAPADELFVDFGMASYQRALWFDREVEVLRPAGNSQWVVDPSVALMDWLEYINGAGAPAAKISGFIEAASDALRAVEFVHNYAVPDDLWDFVVFLKGDVDSDGDVDRNDIYLIISQKGADATLFPAYDLDGDGRITSLDVNIALRLCTRLGCRTE